LIALDPEYGRSQLRALPKGTASTLGAGTDATLAPLLLTLADRPMAIERPAGLLRA
jgi:hypothetical protein